MVNKNKINESFCKKTHNKFQGGTAQTMTAIDILSTEILSGAFALNHCDRTNKLVSR